jgi:hypothetical protein
MRSTITYAAVFVLFALAIWFALGDPLGYLN